MKRAEENVMIQMKLLANDLTSRSDKRVTVEKDGQLANTVTITVDDKAFSFGNYHSAYTFLRGMKVIVS